MDSTEPTDATWITDYDYTNQVVSLTLCSESVIGHHWTPIGIDHRLSDPDGDFVVFTTRSTSGEEPSDVVKATVKIMIRLNRYGELAAWHPDCVAFIGSPTIWPGNVAAPGRDVSNRRPPEFDRMGLAHWIWWWDGPMWGTSEPRSWCDATPDMPWRRRDTELPSMPDVAEELAGSVTGQAPNLTEDELVDAVVDGAAHPHLYEWADALVQAVEDVAGPEAAWDIQPLTDLLRTAVDLRRGGVSPFANYLEAPETIIELYGVHGKAMRELTEARDRAFRPMLRDVASAVFGLLGRPVSWNDLIERGASPVRPPAPDSDDW